MSYPHPYFLHDQLLLAGLVISGIPDLFEVSGEEDLGTSGQAIGQLN